MRKLSSFAIPAFAAVFAIFAAIISCSDKLIDELDSVDLDKLRGDLQSNDEEFIKACFPPPAERAPDWTRPSWCEDFIPSSSSVGAVSPCEGDECQTPSSSSSSYAPPCTGDDCDEPIIQPSSSSVVYEEVVIAGECEEDDGEVEGFACAFDPSEPIFGDDVSWDKGSHGSCETTLKLGIRTGGNFPTEGVYTFPSSLSFPASGKWVAQDNSEAVRDLGDGSSDVSISGIMASIVCNNDGVRTCSEETCSLTIKKAPEPEVTGDIAFSNGNNITVTAAGVSHSTVYYLGEAPSFTSTVNVNNKIEACKDANAAIKYRMRVGTGDWSDCISNSCPALAATITEPRVVTLEAYIEDCRGVEKLLKTAAAAVVPNPSLTGSCAWDTKNNTWGGGVKATVATPPTISNQHGRDCEGPYFTVDGAKKENVSAGLTVDAWTSDGQTMGGISIGAACGGAALTPSIACPNITVMDPDATCEYEQVKPCGNILRDNIKVGSDFGGYDNNRKETESCTYVLSITGLRFGNISANGYVNINNKKGPCSQGGEDNLERCSAFLQNVDKIDDGYYIYINSASLHSNGVNVGEASQLSSNCR